MEQALYQLLSELKQHDVASPLICQGLLLRIFRILGTNYEFSLSKQLRKQMNWILFEEITDYMENHLTQISITGLSEEFHFQEDYFNRLIKHRPGLPIRNTYSFCACAALKRCFLRPMPRSTRSRKRSVTTTKVISIKYLRNGTSLRRHSSAKRCNYFFRFILQIPFPVSYLRQILTVLVDVLFVLYEFVVHLLYQIRSSVSKLWQIFDDVLY